MFESTTGGPEHRAGPLVDLDTVQVESILECLSLPGADLNLGLDHYVDLVCTVLDIPVNK